MAEKITFMASSILFLATMYAEHFEIEQAADFGRFATIVFALWAIYWKL